MLGLSQGLFNTLRYDSVPPNQKNNPNEHVSGNISFSSQPPCCCFTRQVLYRERFRQLHQNFALRCIICTKEGFPKLKFVKWLFFYGHKITCLEHFFENSHRNTHTTKLLLSLNTTLHTTVMMKSILNSLNSTSND